MAGERLSIVKIVHLGEDRLIALLTRRLVVGSDVRTGVGDDCAIIGAPRARHWQLLKTDAVVENIHFRPEEDLRRVGWKALCRAMSDVAAMGGIPLHALVTVAVAGDTRVSEVKALYSGLRAAARKFDVSIVGGETSRSPGPLFISIALSGRVERARCVTRGGGAPGDLLYVTGRLGGAQRGRHLTFIPRIAEARWLVLHFKVHAMMDLSDGLAADLPRMARASRCDFSIDEDLLPRASGCSVRDALSDGEDFELLFALAPEHAARLARMWRTRFPKIPLTRIGSLTRKGKGSGLRTRARGYDHFA